MKHLLRLEYLALLVLSLFLFTTLNYAWWWYIVLFLLPDVGMIGYLINPKIGAITYNLTHHFAVAVAVYIIGSIAHTPWIELAGIIMLGHSAFDRLLGYGLKYSDNFKHTHLGEL